MKFKNKYSGKIAFTLFQITTLIIFSHSTFAADTIIETPQISVQDKSGVFIFTSDEFKLSSEDFGKHLIGNGLDESALRVYTESATFGFKEFSEEVVRHSSKLTSVMVLFNFHGAEAGGCLMCTASNPCLQGNLSAIGHRFIPAQQIVDDFLVPLTGKKILLFFQSCFSGHFAKKVEQIASTKEWKMPTPIAFIATDNNKPTSTLYFPFPDYARKTTKFRHWDDLTIALRYESMRDFSDYAQFIRAWNHGFDFTFFELNGGRTISVDDFGFKDRTIQPVKELQEKIALYKSAEEKLRGVDTSNLVVVIAEREREYENLAHGDMWLNAFFQNGVSEDNIHWIKLKKIGEDVDNPQVHALTDTINFISPAQRVLLFIRGDDILKDPAAGIESNKWAMMFQRDQALSAETIATILLPQLGKAQRVLVLICSTYADRGFHDLVPIVEKEKLDNVAIVSFFSPERDFYRTTLCGWPMGFLAPLYRSKFLFYMDGRFRDLFFKDEHVRELAVNGIKSFESMVSFEDYLKFLQTAEHFFLPKQIAVKTHKCGSRDLNDFGFLPKTMPQSWYGW